MNYQKSDFFFELPEGQIARRPLPERSASRLLVVRPHETPALHDAMMRAFPDFLNAKDLLVFNNTRVLPARMFGRKESGGRVEILVERLKNDHCVTAHLKASKAPKAGSKIIIAEVEIFVTAREGDLFVLESPTPWASLMAAHGSMPTPPYFERVADDEDRERYQTVYAKNPGAVAAPTAGLHFDAALLAALEARGVQRAEITLHVGAGTFQPVRVEDLRQHPMHAEWLEVSPEVVAQVAATKARGGRVVAVGTTSLRALESAAVGGTLTAYAGDTRLFITPGYRFRVVDALLTNFHLPESTLLMLVSALAGYDLTRQAYAHAIASGYRFYSYGDAMLIAHAA